MEHHSKKETGNKLENADHAGPCKLCEEFWIISGVRERHQAGELHDFIHFEKITLCDEWSLSWRQGEDGWMNGCICTSLHIKNIFSGGGLGQ